MWLPTTGRDRLSDAPSWTDRRGQNRVAAWDCPSLAPIHRESPPVHSVLMPPPRTPPLRCRLVSPTPIYDQLRGERINADVPATGAGRQRVDRPGKHCLPAGAPPAAVAGRSPGAGSARAAGWSWFGPTAPPMPAANTRRVESAREPCPGGRTYPAAQPAGSDQRAAATGGPHGPLPSGAHARPEQAQPGRHLPGLATVCDDEH